MQRSDYNYLPLSEPQYEQIIAAGTMQGTSPVAGAANWSSMDAACKSGNVDPRVLLAALLFEDHFGTDPAGGVVLAKVFNFGGIKWPGAPGPAGWYDSGIPCPPNEGGTYAGFRDFGSFILALCDTLNNEYCGPSFREGDLVGAWAIYVGGPNNPNRDAGQNRVDQWQYYLAHYPPQGGTPVVTTGVYGEDVARAALKHLGQTHEYDPLNGDHQVYYMCEADVEDWCAEAGVPQPAMPDAKTNAARLPLNTTFPAPVGALLFFEGPGWSQYGHVGISYSDEGGTISGLNAVTVSSGWQSTAVGCVGWRFPDGVTAAHPSVPVVDPTIFYAPDNPHGAVPMRAPFWNRWDAVNTMGTKLDHPGALNPSGLALPMIGYPVAPEMTLPSGRRVQQFERGWLGTQQAPDPWDVVMLLSTEVPK